jgi:hypothetical protein
MIYWTKNIFCALLIHPKNKPSALKDPILYLGEQSHPNNPFSEINSF